MAKLFLSDLSRKPSDLNVRVCFSVVVVVVVVVGSG